MSVRKGDTYVEFNNAPRILLVDVEGAYISKVNQIEANRLIVNGFCKLKMAYPVTLVFKDKVSEWDNGFLSFRPSKWKKDRKWLSGKKSVVYGNFRVQSPQGELMFLCNTKKALWYMNREKVDIICEDPPTLRFRFQPKGKGNIEDDYQLNGKKNECVVCSKKSELTRHHVVPYVFRKHMPLEIKDHNCYDVLLLCVDCHERYETKATEFKRQLCEEYEVDVNVGEEVYLSEQARAIKACFALLRHADKIPASRKEILYNIIKTQLGKDEITKEDMEEYSKNKMSSDGGENYGYHIMQKVGDVQTFVERWRAHFVDCMKPEFLPKYWEVNKTAERIK